MSAIAATSTFAKPNTTSAASAAAATVKLVVGATGKAELVLRNAASSTDAFTTESKHAHHLVAVTEPKSNGLHHRKPAGITLPTTTSTIGTSPTSTPSTPEDDCTGLPPLIQVAATVDVYATKPLHLDMDMGTVQILRRWQFVPHTARVPVIVDFVDLCRPWAQCSTLGSFGVVQKHSVVFSFDATRHFLDAAMPKWTSHAAKSNPSGSKLHMSTTAADLANTHHDGPEDVAVVIGHPRGADKPDGGKYVRLVSLATKLLPRIRTPNARFTLVGIEAFTGSWFTVRTEADRERAIDVLRRIALGSLVPALAALWGVQGDEDEVATELEGCVRVMTHDECRAELGDEAYENETCE